MNVPHNSVKTGKPLSSVDLLLECILNQLSELQNYEQCNHA